MDINAILLIVGLYLTIVGAVLISLQVAIVRRFKGIEKSFAKTIMPGHSLIVLGVVLLFLAQIVAAGF